MKAGIKHTQNSTSPVFCIINAVALNDCWFALVPTAIAVLFFSLGQRYTKMILNQRFNKTLQLNISKAINSY